MIFFIRVNARSFSFFGEHGDGDVRLTGGTSYKGGRVEVYNDYNDAWYSVCRDTSWGQVDAQVICNVHELELESEDEDFGPGLYPGIISYVDCIGTESSFKFCDYNLEDEDCGSDDHAVGVVCKDYSGKLKMSIQLNSFYSFQFTKNKRSQWLLLLVWQQL